jgi:hypothetical protein
MPYGKKHLIGSERSYKLDLGAVAVLGSMGTFFLLPILFDFCIMT